MSDGEVFWRFTRQIFRQWASLRGAILLVLTILGLLLGYGTNLPIPSVLWILFLFVALYWAGYRAYLDIYERLPSRAEFTIDVKESGLGRTSWRSHVLSGPLQLRIRLDVANHGEEKGWLTNLDLNSLHCNSPLFVEEQHKTSFVKTNRPHASRKVKFPLAVDGRDRETNLEYQIEVEHDFESPEHFAELVGKLESYQVELYYEYEDSDRHVYDGRVTVQGDYESFRQQCYRSWTDGGRADLLSIAAEL